MRDDWEKSLPDIVQLPGFYGLHDQDVDTKGEPRKTHIHLTLCWEGPTTRKSAKEVANWLSAPGKTCCSTASPVPRMRGCYDYARHDTEAAQKAGKVLYPEENRVCFNGFEIGFYEHISQEEKDQMAYELSRVIHNRKIENMDDLSEVIETEYDFRYFQVFKGNNAFFDRLCRGVYLKRIGDKPSKDAEAAKNFDASRVAMAPVIARAGDGTRMCVCEECGEVKPSEDFATYGGQDNPNVGLCKDCADLR